MKSPYLSKDELERLCKEYPRGCRVELVYLLDPFSHLKPGDLGTVVFVDGIGTIHVDWDNGSSLGVVYGVDRIRKV